jgi:hypothetical protein
MVPRRSPDRMRPQKGETVMSKPVTKANLQQRLGDLVAGTQKHFPNGSLTFGGATYTPAVLIQLFQSLDDATTGMDVAKAKWQDALKAQRGAKAKVGPVMQAYRSYLVSLFGNAVETLADFGLTPHKAPAPQTAEQKATAAAKRKATRAARHTMGTKQKAGIKGTVTTAGPPVATTAPAKPITQ